jgi:hypothetical protein
MPNYIEDQHLMVMGNREDSRVYYAVIAIPEKTSERKAAYEALKEKFNSFLKEEATSVPYTPMDYALLVERTIRECNGFALDVFPDGE